MPKRLYRLDKRCLGESGFGWLGMGGHVLSAVSGSWERQWSSEVRHWCVAMHVPKETSFCRIDVGALPCILTFSFLFATDNPNSY